jgi:hypothetical protein
VSIVDGPGLKDDRLRILYQRTPGPIAYIDESLREPGRGERPFYAMSAIVIARDQAAMIRQRLIEIAGSDYWHTTEAFSSPLGRHVITEMNDYLAHAIEPSIITVQTEIRRADHNLRTAREECITALAREVTRVNTTEAPRLLVFEKRNRRYYPDGDKQDLAVLHRLRAARLLHPQVTGYHASPGDEPLLWAPDLVAWSFRRDLAIGDSQWFTPYETVATVLHARTGLAVKRSNPHLPQPSPGVQPTTGPLQGGQPAVASASSLVHQGKENENLTRLRAQADAHNPPLDHSVGLAVGTDTPRTLASIENQFQRYLAAQRARSDAAKPSPDVARLLAQARAALAEEQQRPDPPQVTTGIAGPRL